MTAIARDAVASDHLVYAWPFPIGPECEVSCADDEQVVMCPACLASLVMMIAGATSTGGVAALLIHGFRVKKGAKKMVGVGRSEWTQTKEK